jgi:prepilin-type N-terminal cleavage/methylation domain-containing protein
VNAGLRTTRFRIARRLGRVVHPEPAERGASLIELIVAMALISVGVVAVVFGLSTNALVSDVHRKQATAGSEVRNFAEKVLSYTHSGTTYVACAGTTAYASAYTAPTGFTRSITAVRYWTGSAWSTTCTTDIGLQKLSLSVSSSDNRATERLEIVIRKPCEVGQTACT